MNKTDLDNYLSRKVIISLSDGSKYRGFLKKIDNENIILQNLQYSKEIVLRIDQVISIRILSDFFEKFRKHFFHNK
jgi:small nuclear ribonucleoprotein (snRNP)-like protein